MVSGTSITYRQLLYNLEHLCECRIRRLDEDGETYGLNEADTPALYAVERSEHNAPYRYTLIDVYIEDLIVLPDVLRTVCRDLDLGIETVIGRRLN